LILGVYTPALCLGVCYSSVVFEELFAPVGLKEFAAPVLILGAMLQR